MKTAENKKNINPKIISTKKKSKDISPIISIMKKERKNNSVEKRGSERNDKNHFKHLNRTFNYHNTEISEQYRAKLKK